MIKVITNTQGRVKDSMPGEMMDLFKEMDRKIQNSLVEGEWEKLKAMMDWIVEHLYDDDSWQELDEELLSLQTMAVSGSEEMDLELGRMLAKLGLLAEDCEGEEDWHLCCLTHSLEQGLHMLETATEDMDAMLGELEQAMEGMLETVEEMVMEGLEALVWMTEKNAMACMLESMVWMTEKNAMAC